MSLIDPLGLQGDKCTIANGCRDPHAVWHEPGLGLGFGNCTLDDIPINCGALLRAIQGGFTNVPVVGISGNMVTAQTIDCKSGTETTPMVCTTGLTTLSVGTTQGPVNMPYMNHSQWLQMAQTLTGLPFTGIDACGAGGFFFAPGLSFKVPEIGGGGVIPIFSFDKKGGGSLGLLFEGSVGFLGGGKEKAYSLQSKRIESTNLVFVGEEAGVFYGSGGELGAYTPAEPSKVTQLTDWPCATGGCPVVPYLLLFFVQKTPALRPFVAGACSPPRVRPLPAVERRKGDLTADLFAASCLE